MGASFLLKGAHLELFVRHSAPTFESRKIVRSLLHAVDDGGPAAPTCTRLPRAWEAEPKARLDVRQVLFLNLRNPTGRYSLGLANPCDRAAALRLQALCAFESKLLAAQGRPDVSQHGNYQPVRNLRLGQELTGFSDLELPSCGILQLDYASAVRPPQGGTASKQLVQRLCTAIEHSRVPWADALRAFATVADRLCLAASDVRALIEAFAVLPGQPRHASVEVLVTCFARCCERAALVSTAVLHSRDLFSQDDATELRSRLGRAHVLDWQRIDAADTNLPDGNKFSLDLACNEDRQVARCLLAIARREDPGGLAEREWAGEPWPESWISGEEELPSSGLLSCIYALEDPNKESQEGRAEAAQRVLGW
mmetsp:Transcript_57680/g.178703  ORF Transcript_57680/g.178703 Transcript_57680/m.178703 type:complete len:367 (-) Transcript_57680:84-1184(-)